MCACFCACLHERRWSWSWMPHTGVYCRAYLSSISGPHPLSPSLTPSATSAASFVADLPSHLCPRGMRWAWPCVGVLRVSLQILVVLHGSKFVRCWGMFKMDRYDIVCVCVCVNLSSTTSEDQEIERWLYFFLSKCRFHAALVYGCFSKGPVISCVSCAVKFSLKFIPRDQTLY